MAAAHVVGAAAMLFSHFPDCTNNQIRNAMVRSTTKPSLEANVSRWDQRYGWGIVNVGKAYELLEKGCVYAGGVHHNSTPSGIQSDQAHGGKNQIAVGVSTVSSNPRESNSPTAPPHVSCAQVDWCGATLDTWTGIPGYSIADLSLGTENFIKVPNTSTRLTNLLEGPSNFGDYYGSRMKGWLVPPTSGEYTFWISSNSDGEFWLSNSSDPENKVLVCHQPGPWSYMREWDHYPEQRSKVTSLVAGQAYYYEVRDCWFKEKLLRALRL